MGKDGYVPTELTLAAVKGGDGSPMIERTMSPGPPTYRTASEKAESLISTSCLSPEEMEDRVFKFQDEIQKILNTCRDLPIEHSFFLSHYQANASDIAAMLNIQLEKNTEMSCWFDQTVQKKINLEGMIQGIVQSAVFMLILTKGVLSREWVQKEVLTALELKKKIVIVYEIDQRVAGYCGSFDEYLEGAPESMKEKLRNIEGVKYQRPEYLQNAMLNKLMEDCQDHLLMAKESRKPMDILEENIDLLEPDLAACYVDFGSGQTVIYLFAIAVDKSLHYYVACEDKEGCFLDYTEQQRDQKRATYVAKFSEVAKMLNSYEGRSVDNLFEVYMGGTSKFRNASSEAVASVESWFKSVIQESELGKATERAGFFGPSLGVMDGQDEARYEWLAIKQGCLGTMPEPHCACAAGNGSVQVSMNNKFLSLDLPLQEGANFIMTNGIEAYQQHIEKQIKLNFSSFGSTLTKVRSGETLRIVIISSFYYAAKACGAIMPGAPVHYQGVVSLISKATELLETRYDGEEGKAKNQFYKDQANCIRLLKLLEVVTESEYENVEVLIVREWKVRNRDYKATWATGRFIDTVKNRCVFSKQKLAAKKNDKVESPESKEASIWSSPFSFVYRKLGGGDSSTSSKITPVTPGAKR